MSTYSSSRVCCFLFHLLPMPVAYGAVEDGTYESFEGMMRRTGSLPYKAGSLLLLLRPLSCPDGLRKGCHISISPNHLLKTKGPRERRYESPTSHLNLKSSLMFSSPQVAITERLSTLILENDDVARAFLHSSWPGLPPSLLSLNNVRPSSLVI